jgi:hypothetical protein
LSLFKTLEINCGKEGYDEFNNLAKDNNHAHYDLKSQTILGYLSCSSGLRICLQNYVIDIGHDAGEDKSNEQKCGPRGFRLIAFRTTVETEVLQRNEQQDAYLLQLKVTIRVYQLILLVIQEDEGDKSPEDLEISFKLYQELKRHIRDLSEV